MYLMLTYIVEFKGNLPVTMSSDAWMYNLPSDEVFNVGRMVASGAITFGVK